MLWTDGYPIASLTELDNDAAQVAAAEENPIDLNQIANLAYSECSSRLREAMSVGGLSSSPESFDAHAWVLFGEYAGRNRAAHDYDLMNVCLSKTMPAYTDLMLWYGYTALVQLYRTAFSNNQTDRYQAKILTNDAEVRKAWYRITASGVPLVRLPLSRPGAKFDPFAGTWTTGNITQIATPGATGGAFYVAVSWVAGSVESALSDAVLVNISADNTIRVSISTLTPPSGTAPSIYQGFTFPTAKASGWNIYAGSSAAALYKQNASVIPVGTTSYDFAAAPVNSGTPAGYGQRADEFLLVQRFLNRA